MCCVGKRGRAIQPAGSMRQRTRSSWELRAYAGVDALTGKVRYRTRTVRGSKAEAVKALRELVASAQAGPAFLVLRPRLRPLVPGPTESECRPDSQKISLAGKRLTRYCIRSS